MTDLFVLIRLPSEEKNEQVTKFNILRFVVSLILWRIIITTIYLPFFVFFSLSSRTFAMCFYYIFALFILVPDFYHHSQADYNVYCTTVNLSYVMNINVAGLLGGTQRTNVTCRLWDEGRKGKRVLLPSPQPAWMFFVTNPGENVTHLARIYFYNNYFYIRLHAGVAYILYVWACFIFLACTSLLLYHL
jgi:hypothetical protein